MEERNEAEGRAKFAGYLAELARQLPDELVYRVARRLELAPAPQPHELVELAVTAEARVALDQLEQRIQRNDVPLEVAAMGLRAALAESEWQTRTSGTELVWTGPLSRYADWRLTEPVLLHLINAAQRELWLVTFAAYRVESVARALEQAAQRQVIINFVAESADASEGRILHDAFTALGTYLPRQTRCYIWPRDKRPTDAQGRFGVLHAKCVVSDDNLALISSANLTGNALNLNIEAGVLLRGLQAARMAAMLREQVQDGVFSPL